MWLQTVSQNRQGPLDPGGEKPGRPSLDIDCASLSSCAVQGNRRGFRCKGSGSLADAEDELGISDWAVTVLDRELFDSHFWFTAKTFARVQR